MSYLNPSKIDKQATDGLLGVQNSLAYRIHNIEQTMLSGGRRFGVAASPTATHKADHIGPGIAPFVMDAGNETWGSWLQITGSEDTPFRAGMTYFKPTQLAIVAAEEEAVYFVQITRGASGDAGITAGTYSDLIVCVDATKKFKQVFELHTGKAPAGSLLWARCLCYGNNTGTLSFYFGIQEYPG